MAMCDAILMELEQEAAATRRVLERVPDGKLEWRPHPKSRTLGELALHIATSPGGVAMVGNMEVFEIPEPPNQQPKTRQEILDAFEASLIQARQELAKVDDARAAAQWTGTKGGKTVMALPRIAFLRGILLNHLYHHRGQLSVYLRLLDIPVPAIYGPSADENPFGG